MFLICCYAYLLFFKLICHPHIKEKVPTVAVTMAMGLLPPNRLRRHKTYFFPRSQIIFFGSTNKYFFVVNRRFTTKKKRIQEINRVADRFQKRSEFYCLVRFKYAIQYFSCFPILIKLFIDFSVDELGSVEAVIEPK